MPMEIYTDDESYDIEHVAWKKRRIMVRALSRSAPIRARSPE